MVPSQQKRSSSCSSFSFCSYSKVWSVAIGWLACGTKHSESFSIPFTAPDHRRLSFHCVPRNKAPFTTAASSTALHVGFAAQEYLNGLSERTVAPSGAPILESASTLIWHPDETYLNHLAQLVESYTYTGNVMERSSWALADSGLAATSAVPTNSFGSGGVTDAVQQAFVDAIASVAPQAMQQVDLATSRNDFAAATLKMVLETPATVTAATSIPAATLVQPVDAMVSLSDMMVPTATVSSSSMESVATALAIKTIGAGPSGGDGSSTSLSDAIATASSAASSTVESAAATTITSTNVVNEAMNEATNEVMNEVMNEATNEATNKAMNGVGGMSDAANQLSKLSYESFNDPTKAPKISDLAASATAKFGAVATKVSDALASVQQSSTNGQNPMEQFQQVDLGKTLSQGTNQLFNKVQQVDIGAALEQTKHQMVDNTSGATLEGAKNTKLGDIGPTLLHGIQNIGNVLLRILNALVGFGTGGQANFSDFIASAQASVNGVIAGATNAISTTIHDIGEKSVAEAAQSFVALLLAVVNALIQILGAVVQAASGKPLSEWTSVATRSFEQEAAKLTAAATDLSDKSLSELSTMIGLFLEHVGQFMTDSVTALNTGAAGVVNGINVNLGTTLLDLTDGVAAMTSSTGSVTVATMASNFNAAAMASHSVVDRVSATVSAFTT